MILRGVVGALLVLVGGVVTTPLPRSLGATLAAPLSGIGATMHGRMLGLAFEVAGLALLSWSWLTLLHRCRLARRSPDASTSALSAARLATWAWSLPILLAPPLFSRDGFSYIAQGELTRRMLSPYVHAPVVLGNPWSERVDPRWMETVTPYGPVPLVWGAVSTTLTRDPWVAIVLERSASVLGVALLTWALPRLARWSRRDPATVTALVTAGPLMVAHGIGGLHNDVLLAGCAASALALAGCGRWGWASVLGGVAAAIKVPGGLVCVGIVLVSLAVGASLKERLQRIVAVGAVSVATLALCGLPYGLGLGWLSALAVPGEVLTPFSVSTTVGRTVGWVVNHLGRPDLWSPAVTTARVLGMVVAVLVAAGCALRATCGDRLAALRSTALIMLSVLLLGPVVHAWYALWVVPFVAALPLGIRQMRTLLAVTVVGGISAPLDSSLEGMVPAIILTTAMILAVAVPLLARIGPVSHVHRPQAYDDARSALPGPQLVGAATER